MVRAEDVVQRCSCRGGAEVMQRWCRGAEVLQRFCRGGAEIVQRWCKMQQCRVAGAEVVQRWCRGG